MKRFITNTFVFSFWFSLFFAALNFLFLVILIKTDWDFRKRVESLKFDNPVFDLLVLGNSLALDGIDAELLTDNGIISYNLAIGGSSPRTSYIQLKEYLEVYQRSPDYVLLGLGSYVSRLDGEEIHPVIEFTMENHKYSIRDIPLIKFKWLGVELAKKIVSSTHRNARLSYGQLKFKRISPDNTAYDSLDLDVQMFENSFYIGEIVRICRQNDIKLFIIEMPGFKNTQNSYDTGPFILNFSNGQSALLYNLNSRTFCEIFDSNQDWIANSHLNETGARKFTKELLEIIREPDY
jgi:hypothetical protein